MYQLALLILMNTEGFNWAIEAIMGTVVLFSLIITAWRPYFLKIHNVGLVFNQLSVMVFCLASLLLKYQIIQTSFFNLLLYLVIVLIFVSNFLAFVRIHMHRTNSITNKEAK
jgi:hypothetical protein